MRKSRIKLRAATIDDADAIHGMVLAMARETGATGSVTGCVDDFRRFGFSGSPSFQALIAERDGVAVGMCIYFNSFSTWRGTRGAYLQDIYVAEAERGSTLARRLIAETARRAGEQGAQYLRLSVDAQNISAQKFYEKIGLSFCETERIYMAKDDAFEALKLLENTE